MGTPAHVLISSFPELVLVELVLLAVEAEHGEACGAVEDGVAVGQPPHAALGVLLPRRALLAVAAAGVGRAQVVHPPLVLVVGVGVVEEVVVGQLFPVGVSWSEFF